jgi:hypothetical protein
MASDDEPMKVSLQPYATSGLSLRALAMMIVLSFVYAMLVEFIKIWLGLDRHSPDTSVLIIVVSTSGIWVSKAGSTWKSTILTGLLFLGFALVGFASAQLLYAGLHGIGPLLLNRFLIYLPLSILALVVVPRLARSFVIEKPIHRLQLKPFTTALLVILFAAFIAGAEVLQSLISVGT